MAAVENWPAPARGDSAVILEFKKRQRIYSGEQPPLNIYLVLSGKVKISRIVNGAHLVVVDVISTGGIFGESALLSATHRPEEAAAMYDTVVMAWPANSLLEMFGESALTLLQAFAQRILESAHRIESLSIDAVDRRLVLSLLRLAERLGTRHPDGAIEMMPMTHEFLAHYIGTSRENVTRVMNRLRRQGYLDYSRQAIRISYNDLLGWLEQPPSENKPVAMVQ